jgi:hypothetical protein
MSDRTWLVKLQLLKMDHKPDVIKEAIALQEQLPKATVQKLLWDNPVRFYGLD